MDLSGICPPICTPFLASGALAVRHLRANIRKYNAVGLRGYVACGSTGEAALLSREEKLRIWEVVREAAAPGRLVIAGAGAESVRETVALVAAAHARGCDAALILTPHYYKGPMAQPETQLGYFRAVADAAKIPILLYNLPQATGIDLEPDVVRQLAEHPNIAGIKESSPEIEKVERLIAGVPKGFPVLTGASSKYAASLALGATGGILAVADALPAAAVQIHECHAAGDAYAARLAQGRILATAGIAPRLGIAGLKYAMDLLGFYGGPPRAPLLPPSAEQRREIEEILHAGSRLAR